MQGYSIASLAMTDYFRRNIQQLSHDNIVLLSVSDDGRVGAQYPEHKCIKPTRG